MLAVTAPNLILTFPSTWEEVTLLQFQKLVDAGSNERAILRALCSHPDRLGELPDATADSQILQQLAFLRDVPTQLFEPRYIPELIVDEKTIRIPKDINLESLAQRWELDDWLEEIRPISDPTEQKEGEPVQEADLHLAALPILAIYLCPYITQEVFTDIEQAKVLAPFIENIPVTIALPLAAFFLTRRQHPTPSGRISLSISYPGRVKRKWLRRWYPNWMRRFFASIRPSKPLPPVAGSASMK